MLQIAPQMRILVAIEPVDLRKGMDGLAELCREKLSADPFSGCLFVFRRRRATAIKLCFARRISTPATRRQKR
jgi:transposase